MPRGWEKMQKMQVMKMWVQGRREGPSESWWTEKTNIEDELILNHRNGWSRHTLVDNFFTPPNKSHASSKRLGFSHQPKPEAKTARSTNWNGQTAGGEQQVVTIPPFITKSVYQVPQTKQSISKLPLENFFFKVLVTDDGWPAVTSAHMEEGKLSSTTSNAQFENLIRWVQKYHTLSSKISYA